MRRLTVFLTVVISTLGMQENLPWLTGLNWRTEGSFEAGEDLQVKKLFRLEFCGI